MTFAEKAAQAPEGPGVYLLKDRRGRVVYVGKARNLRDRLRSYIQPRPDTASASPPRLVAMASRFADLETIVTRSETEALVLEENLIKIKKPRYNVRLRDDKKFPYLKVTVQERFPRIYPTRNLKADGSLLFGPYTSARELRRALKGVKRIFRIRTCSRDLPDEAPARPCLAFQLNRCSGPCRKDADEAEYREQVKDVVDFLSGRSDQLTQELEKRMWQASEAQRFERAAILRDQLMALRDIRRSQQAVSRDTTARDVIGLARGERHAVAAMFRIREGKIVAREEYPLAAGKDSSDSEILATVLRSVHMHVHDLPDEIVLPTQIEDVAFIEQWFQEKRNLKVRVVVPERGERMSLLDLARRNAEKALVEVSPEERIPKANQELAQILGLASTPRVIEGVDISNTSGQQAVGSVVVFHDTRPAKKEYRLFRVRTVEGPNDFAMMEEVLARRVRGLLERNEPLPDLVLVDGGKGQLSSAVRAYHQFDQEIPIMGLAKRTDTLYYLDGREISVPVTSPALKLLKRIRDESHRFAVRYHRKLRGEKLVQSELDAVSGLGPARKRLLVRHFGSLERLRVATAEEIAEVRGFGPALSERVHEQLHG